MMSENKINDLNELENVSGGVASSDDYDESVQLMKISCPHCYEVFETNVQRSSAKCPACQKTFAIKG